MAVDATHNVPDFQTGIINVIHAADTNVYYQSFILNKTYNTFNTDMVTALFNEQREMLRYQWATSQAANYGLARVTGMSSGDATRFK